MGYERNDRRFGGSGQGGDRGRSYGYQGGYQQDRGYGDRGRGGYRGDAYGGRSDYGRGPQGYDYQDRGFLDRAGDEVRSWFGDEEADRRRREDERYDRSYEARTYGDDGYERSRGDAYRGERSWDRGVGPQASQRRHHHDDNYQSWRDRQIAAFDRDYDEYRRENQGRFESEFGAWRQTREGQRDLVRRVQEHQEVVGSDGQHVGKVDHVQGDQIKLAKSDQDAGGRHHLIPSAWVQSVDDKITLNKTADQARQHWRDEGREQGGLFGNDTDHRATNLNRSFSGTY